MKNQPLVIGEWSSVVGSDAFDFSSEGVRRIDIPVITQGAAFIVQQEGRAVCVGAGRGSLSLCFGASGEFRLVVVGDKPGFVTSLRLPWAREVVKVGWVDGPSFTDANPKDGPQVSREVQLMFEAMQRNMLAREARLREELTRR